MRCVKLFCPPQVRPGCDRDDEAHSDGPSSMKSITAMRAPFVIIPLYDGGSIGTRVSDEDASFLNIFVFV